MKAWARLAPRLRVGPHETTTVVGSPPERWKTEPVTAAYVRAALAVSPLTTLGYLSGSSVGWLERHVNSRVPSGP